MGEEEGGDRQIGRQTARGAFISTERTKSQRWTVALESLKESLKREREKSSLTLTPVISQAMAMSDPGQRMPEEQDYVQAYENVREKYKGNNTTVFSSLYCTI